MATAFSKYHSGKHALSLVPLLSQIPDSVGKGCTIFGEMTFGDQTFGEMTFGERLLLFQTFGDLDFW